MRRRTPLFLNPRRILAIFLLILLILVLSFYVFLAQQETKSSVQVPGATSSPNPAISSNPIRSHDLAISPSPTGSLYPTTSPDPATSPNPATSYPANIDYEGASGYGTYNPSALANPHVGAVAINMNWVDVEPQQGVFNWAPADHEVAAWVATGKRFTLIVRYIKEGTAGTDCSSPQLTPSWEIARIQSFCDTDMGTLLPDYFDPMFRADLKAYVQAIATHFAASPYRNNLLYERIGVGEGGEGIPFMPAGDYATVDKPQLVSWGYTPTTWAAWQKEMMTSYKNAFSYSTAIYPLNGLDTDPATAQPVQVEVARWAASQGMGVGQQGLQPTTSTPLFRQLRSQYPRIYIQYQTISFVSNSATPSCDATCVVQTDIRAADNDGAQFIEWYSGDVVNAAYQSLFAQWQQMVNSK